MSREQHPLWEAFQKWEKSQTISALNAWQVDLAWDAFLAGASELADKTKEIHNFLMTADFIANLGKSIFSIATAKSKDKK
jgi:hypothetical protein